MTDQQTTILDLLAALKHLVRWHDQLSPADIARAEAAIAKAGGDDKAELDPRLEDAIRAFDAEMELADRAAITKAVRA